MKIIKRLIHSYWIMYGLPFSIIIISLIYIIVSSPESIISAGSLPVLLLTLLLIFIGVLTEDSIETCTFTVGMIATIFSLIQIVGAIALDENPLFPICLLTIGMLSIIIPNLHLNEYKPLSWGLKDDSKAIDTRLFERLKSNTKKIEKFIKTYDNSKFFIENNCTKLRKAEYNMISAIERESITNTNKTEIEKVKVSILKANYSRLLQLKDIYQLNGAETEFNDDSKSSGLIKALSIYQAITNDINNFIDFVDNEEIKMIKLQKDEEIDENKRLLQNSIDLL